MFFKKFCFIALIFLVITLRVFSSPSCEEGAFSELVDSRRNHQEVNKSIIGMETYSQLLIKLAQSSLEIKHLTPEQIKALETYHHIVQGEVGKDGTFARVGNYTFSQFKRIIIFLREAFSEEQVDTLIEDGVVEIERVDPKDNTRRLSRHFFLKRKPAFAIVDELTPEGDNYHRGKVMLLERLDHGVLLKVEKVDRETGETFKEQWFFPIEGNRNRLDSFSQVEQILEKANNGFVLGDQYGNVGFFSFEKAIDNGLLPKNPTIQNYRELEDILNHYISGQLDQIPALEDAFYNGVLSKEHSIYIIFTNSLDKSIVKDSHYLNDVIVTLNSEMEMTFLAAQSNRKKISANDLNLPPLKDKETQLTEQGYNSKYTTGINLINEWGFVRRELQRLKANPYKTHIEYFAAQIPYHIAHIREGLEKNYSPENKTYVSKLDQLQKLNNLEEEAKKTISDEKVTYKWWLEFNRDLAEIMSGVRDPELIESSKELIEVTISYFPLKVVLPATEADLGIIAFNRAGAEGVYPASLINRQDVKADEEIMDSFNYWFHDLAHALVDGSQIYREYSAGHRLFHKKLLHNIEQLSIEKRKKAEVIYFLMTHENEGKIISYANWTLQEMRETIRKMIQEDIAGLFKFSEDPSEKEKKIEDLVDTFMEVYNQTLQHQ